MKTIQTLIDDYKLELLSGKFASLHARVALSHALKGKTVFEPQKDGSVRIWSLSKSGQPAFQVVKPAQSIVLEPVETTAA
jgi:hypothetical protein